MPWRLQAEMAFITHERAEFDILDGIRAFSFCAKNEASTFRIRRKSQYLKGFREALGGAWLSDFEKAYDFGLACSAESKDPRTRVEQLGLPVN